MTDYRSLVRTPLLEESPLNQHRGIVDEKRLNHQYAIFVSEGEESVASGFVAVFGPLQVDEYLRLTLDFFGKRQFEVSVESETGSIIERYLAAKDWACVEEEIAMVLPDIPTPPLATPLEIKQVDDAKTYEAYMSVTPTNRHWVPTLAAATDPNVGLFVGYVDSQPVATSRLTCYEKTAEITGVQTTEEFRRRGYGRAMTWAAIAEAQRRGCHTIVLTATEMGYPLYLEMGFQNVCSYRTYEPPNK
jgi:ribosomal protein S18 acetylase RimI-like enzyme